MVSCYAELPGDFDKAAACNCCIPPRSAPPRAVQASDDLENAVKLKEQLLSNALQRRHDSMRSTQELHHRNFKASVELLSIRSLTATVVQSALCLESNLKRPLTRGAVTSSTAALLQPSHGVVAGLLACSSFSAARLLDVLGPHALLAAATLPFGGPRHGSPSSGTASDPPHPPSPGDPVSPHATQATIALASRELARLHEATSGVLGDVPDAGHWWLQSLYPVSDPLACDVRPWHRSYAHCNYAHCSAFACRPASTGDFLHLDALSRMLYPSAVPEVVQSSARTITASSTASAEIGHCHA